MSEPNAGNRTLLRAILFAFLICAHIAGKSAFAGILLDPINQQVWDRDANPLGFQVTFGISPNNQPPTENLLNTFSIGIMIVPDAIQNGNVRIQSVTIPTINPVFTTFSDLRFSGGTTQVVTGDNQLLPGGQPRNFELVSQKNIFTAFLSSPGSDAQGGFKIFAVPLSTTYFTESNFDGEKFFNVPDGGAPVLVGSFNVNISAVPEASSLLLASLVAGGLAAMRLRRNRRLAKTLIFP